MKMRLDVLEDVYRLEINEAHLASGFLQHHLPKLSGEVSDPSLKSLLDDFCAQNEKHSEQLATILARIGTAATGRSRTTRTLVDKMESLLKSEGILSVVEVGI